MIDAIGYVRVSTEQQATERKTSLEDQKRLITEMAARLGRVLDPSMIFEDAGVSGLTAEGRPAFMALLRYCEANPRFVGTPGLIVMLNDSRLGRFKDPEESAHWRFVLGRLGWPVRFAEGDEVEDTFARGMIRFIGSAQATKYRTDLQRNVIRGLRGGATRGQWQTEAPFGYRRLAIGKNGAERILAIGQRKAEDEVSRLTPGPAEEQELIRWIFESYALGETSLDEMARLGAAKFPALGKAWGKQVIRAMLHNPAYAGDVVWCRSSYDSSGVQKRNRRDRSEWVIYRDAHPALVTREVFDQVHEIFSRNKRQTTATKGVYPLSGLIRCTSCDHHFVGGGGPKGPPEEPERFRFYRCAGAVKRTPVCLNPMSTLRKRWIEKEVMQAIIETVAEPRTRRIIDEELPKLLAQAQDTGKERARDLEKERARLLAQRSRLVSAIAGGTLTETEASVSMAETRARITAVEAERDRLRFAARGESVAKDELARAQALTADYANQMRSLKGLAYRRVVQPWIADAKVDKERRVLILTLWALPGIEKLVHLGTSAERTAQENKVLRRLTTRRTIKLPPTPSQFMAWYNRRHKSARWTKGASV